MVAIINSMTKKERRNPALLNGSRRKRIAAGSGMTPADVNKLMKQYQQMEKMMGKLGRGGMTGMMRGMKGMMGGMGGGGMPVRCSRHGPSHHRGPARERHPRTRAPRRSTREGDA